MGSREHSAASEPRTTASLLVVLCPVAFVGTLGALALGPFLPAIAADLDTSVALLGQIPALTMLLAAAFGLVIGPLADVAGHRRLLLVGLLAVIGGALVTAAAWTYAVLVLVALLGAGSRATLGPVAYAVVGTRLAGEHRRRALSFVVAALGAAAIVGVPLLTLLAARWGWRMAFVGVALLGLVAALLVLRGLPADRAGHGTGVRLGTVLRAYVPLAQDRALLGIYGAALLRNAAVWAAAIYLGAFLVERHGLTLPQVGLAFTAVGVGQVAGSLLAGGRLGAPARPLLAGVDIALGLLVSAFLLLPLGAVAAVGVLTLALVANGAADVLEPSLLARESRGGAATTMTLHGSMQSAGAALGGSLGGVLLALGGYPALGLCVPLAGITAALLIWWLRPHHGTRPLAAAAGVGG